MKLLILFVNLIFINFYSYAETTSKCEDSATTPEIENCIFKDVESKKTQLDEYYKKSLEQIDKKDIKTLQLLKKSQSSWQKSHLEFCDAVYQYWIEGTIRGISYNNCLRNQILNRTRDLWTEFLVAADGTEFLPEPK